jgi:hypothetical protein
MMGPSPAGALQAGLSKYGCARAPRCRGPRQRARVGAADDCPSKGTGHVAAAPARLENPALDPCYVSVMTIGVPSGEYCFSFVAVSFVTRMQPCDTAWPISCGMLVPWMPNQPPPGHSVSAE